MSAQRNLDEAMLRAYSEARCMDYGCSARDAQELRSRVASGEGWSRVAQELANRNVDRSDSGVAGEELGLAVSAALLDASSCLRVAQAAMEDDPSGRLVIFERQLELFKTAMHLTPVQSEYVRVDWKDVPHGAWLFPCEDESRWVVVWGGADGWCEAYHRSVQSFHREKLSVCLLELPGQGIARLKHQSFLTRDFTLFVSSVLDMLAGRAGAPPLFAVAGHSLGGSLALRAAADDKRVVACVTNGGSVEMEKGFKAFPRVLTRFARMLGGSVTGNSALDFLEQLELRRAAGAMSASLLCLHGSRDELVRDSEVQLLLDLHGRASLKSWSDGGHCIYEHADERNAVLAGWIAETFARHRTVFPDALVEP